MTEITVHLDGHAHPIDIHFDGKEGTPISAFVLLTAVPVDPPANHIVTFGNANTIGRLLFSFWKNSCERDPGGAFIIEAVCRDIVDCADAARGKIVSERAH